MPTTDQISISLKAYQQIHPDLSQGEAYEVDEAAISNLKSPPNEATIPLLCGSLQLGLSENGLPLLLDLYDPASGPLLVAGDGGSGKTTFLQSLAQSSSDIQDPGEVQFGVLTPFPEEWSALEALPNCMGIWPAFHAAARNFLSQLVSWADVLPGTRQVILILFDGLDLLTTSGFQGQHDLRWLLTYGPRRHVWPVVTVNPGRLPRLDTWLDYFPTRVLGRVKRPQTANLLLSDPQIKLAELSPGRQYGLSRPEGWLKFQLPSVYKKESLKTGIL
jgi:hypothetical protein